jgi:putative ABC transport system ATP-binding protein
VIENVMLPLAITEKSNREQLNMAEGILEKMSLKGKGRRLPDQLSGGEQERVAIARALVNSPPILLADEPTGNLDSKTGKEIMDLFKSLNDDGQTIVMVTHNPENVVFSSRTIFETERWWMELDFHGLEKEVKYHVVSTNSLCIFINTHKYACIPTYDR